MTLKEEFRTVLYAEMDKVDIPADLDGFDFDKIWAWIGDKLMLQDMEDAESSMNDSVFLQNIEQSKMDGYCEAIDDAIKVCKIRYTEMVFERKFATYIKEHKRNEINVIMEQLKQLKEKK